MNRLDRTHTIRKNVRIEADGIHATYDVIRLGRNYAIDLDLGAGWRSIAVGQFSFAKPDKGQTIAAHAHVVAGRVLRETIAAADAEAIYVVIDDMPAFAEESLGEHTRAGYDGSGKPRYVVRVETPAESEAVIARADAIGTIVDGERQFSPMVVDVTANAYEALDSESWSACDARTFIAAKRVEDVVDAGIPR